jgi:hypothetical protein
MHRAFVVALSVTLAIASVAAQQSFSGRLSDSTCGASHHAKAGGLTDRQCLLACIRALAKWTLVDRSGRLIPIANLDAMGLPLYAGRLVTLTGEMKDGSIVVTKVEAIPAHLHLGHVMTNWRDTPGNRGFLPVAIDEARVAVLHAKLAATDTTIDGIRLHVGHVIHALDIAAEANGPGAGYGVRKAAAGAAQHLDVAAAAEGASAGLTVDAREVSASLLDVLRSVDRTIAAAERARTLPDATAAAAAAADLVTLVVRLDEALAGARVRMERLLEAEGLAGAPR